MWAGPLLEGKSRSILPGPLNGNPMTCFSVWQAKACDAMEALDELLESEMPVITSHLSEILTFCLGVSLGWAWPLLLVLKNFFIFFFGPVSDSP